MSGDKSLENVDRICPKCGGLGEDVMFLTCTLCKGSGEVKVTYSQQGLQPYDCGSGV